VFVCVHVVAMSVQSWLTPAPPAHRVPPTTTSCLSAGSWPLPPTSSVHAPSQMLHPLQVNYLSHWLLLHQILAAQRRRRRVHGDEWQRGVGAGPSLTGRWGDGTRVLLFSSVMHRMARSALADPKARPLCQQAVVVALPASSPHMPLRCTSQEPKSARVCCARPCHGRCLLHSLWSAAGCEPSPAQPYLLTQLC
jgi:hypothetical protein